MPPASPYWKITMSCAPLMADAVETLFEGKALAVSTFKPPRTNKAQVEALFEGEPNRKIVADLRGKLSILALVHQVPAPKLHVAIIENLDWVKKVAADFPPLKIGRWTIYGGAHKDKVKNCRLKLQIDASSAFGTGEHPTTRGCLLMMDQLLKGNRLEKALDIGCGSGILAMAFAQATRGQVQATDLDPLSVAIAQDNLRLNGLSGHIQIAQACGYNAQNVHKHAPYDLIMANIFARPLCLMAKDLKRHLKPTGYAILSGILNSQANAVIAAHRNAGLTLEKRMTLGAWTVLALRRS